VCVLCVECSQWRGRNFQWRRPGPAGGNPNFLWLARAFAFLQCPFISSSDCEPKGDRHIPSPRRGLSVQYVVKACFCFWGWCLSCYPAGGSIFAIGGSIGARSYIVEVYYIYLCKLLELEFLKSGIVAGVNRVHQTHGSSAVVI
jgi:hypothetical protein